MSLLGTVEPLQKNDDSPLYVQLQSFLRTAILRGVVGANETIPSEKDLAHEFAVSRVTVRKAIDGLVGEGLLTRRRGAGTFVMRLPREPTAARLSSFTEDMIARGRIPSSRWIDRAHTTVTPEEALSLGLSPGSAVYRFKRVRCADDVPIAVERSTLPDFALSSVHDVTQSLYAALELTGNRPTRALLRVSAIALPPQEAELLGAEPGTPGLSIERRAFLPTGRPVEVTQSFFKGDAYDIGAEVGHA